MVSVLLLGQSEVGFRSRLGAANLSEPYPSISIDDVGNSNVTRIKFLFNQFNRKLGLDNCLELADLTSRQTVAEIFI